MSARSSVSSFDSWSAATAVASLQSGRLGKMRPGGRGDGAAAGAFDRITKVATRYFGVAIAVVDTDRRWFRSGRGVEAEPISRRANARPGTSPPGAPWVIEDAAQPQIEVPEIDGVSGQRFYAGAPLTTTDGRSAGTFCLMDSEPRRLSGEEAATLVDLAAIASSELELQRACRLLATAELEQQLPSGADQLRAIQDASLHALILAVQARDPMTADHSLSVVNLARSVAAAIGLPASKITEIAQVALLHDIGKVGIPDDILRSTRRLDSVAWEQMREHPVIGEQMVHSLRELQHLAPAVRSAHERWAGGGYPDGLRADSIPIASRIVFACDAYDAMTTDRPYRRASTAGEARAELRDNAGTQFDPEVIAHLIPILEAEGPPEPPRRSGRRFSAHGNGSDIPA